MQINKYTITGSGKKIKISAKNAKQAWAKFCAQNFGALKPARSDYTIRSV